MIVVTGVIMGLILGFVFVFVVETLDTSIGTIEDVESLLGVPVLGAIPFFEKDEKGQGYSIQNLITHFDPTSIIAEAFRSLRTNIRFMGLEKKGKSFLITSSFIQEGKTFNIVNLALSIAQAGDKVLLVEGDLRKPMINKMFGLPREPGLTDYVLGNYQWKEIIVSITDLILGDFEFEDIMKTPGLENLNIMVGGSLPPNPSEILRSPRFSEFLKEASKDYNYIFIDAPPILPVADATEVAPFVDSVILVYKVGQIARGVLKRAKVSLDNVNAKVLGVILNSIKPEIGPDYFKYHTQYYYGASKKAEHTKGSIFDNLVQSMEGPILQSTFFKFMMLLMAVTLLIFGIFWKDLYNALFP
jgi:capsular exopolysaccharide synthesis family protein